MDVVLLGFAAIVLIALTLWIVWRPAPSVVRAEESSQMLPQGDKFEDQYTSATADLSAGGVAVTTSAPDPVMDMPAAPIPRTTDFPSAGEPWSSPSTAREGVRPAIAAPMHEMRALPEPEEGPSRRVVSLGAAALMTVAGAIGGAWFYARWQKRRNTPINRLRRRLK
jgi:hypothetical protein